MMANEEKCPFTGGSHVHANRDWWPKQLDLRVLHQNSTLSDPMGEAFDYAEEFKSLDLNAVKPYLQMDRLRDGMHWAAEGSQFALPATENAVTFQRVAHFGGFLRVAASLPEGAEITVLVSLHLKA